MRDRLCDRPRRRVLREAEGQGTDGCNRVQPAIDRHHVCADRQIVRRQDPDHHRRLRPRRFGGRRGVRLELPSRRDVLGRRGHAGSGSRQEGRRAGQAQGQEDRARVPRFALRQGADCAAGRARQDERVQSSSASGDQPGRRAEGDLAADPAAASRLRLPVGLGRHEFHGHQGGGCHRLSAREDVRRMVVGCGARRRARGRRGEGLQRARVSRTCWHGPGSQGHNQVRLRQGAGHRQEGKMSELHQSAQSRLFTSEGSDQQKSACRAYLGSEIV